MKYRYIGDQDSITLRQVEFPNGKAVDVEDELLAEKISNLDYFEQVKARKSKTDAENAA